MTPAALLPRSASPRHHSAAAAPTTSCSPLHHRSASTLSFVSSRGRRAAVRGVRAASAGGAEERAGTALVWLKRDLRLDDHPGLVAAASRHRNVVPLYVFDPRILAGYPDEMLEILVSILEDLKNILKDQGSDLLIGFGNAEDVILKVVNEVKATHIFVEEEVEYNLTKIIKIVEASISILPCSWGSPEFVIWRTPFYDIENLMELPTSYNDFQKLQYQVTEPLTTAALPALNMKLEQGALPTCDEIKKHFLENSLYLDVKLSSIKGKSAKSILKAMQANQGKILTNQVNQYTLSSNGSAKKSRNSVFISRDGNAVKGGADVAMNALAAYLRYLEGTSKDDWQELHEKLRNHETRTGASFGVLFRYILYFGVLSRRRVYYETIKYEKERNAGFISPFGYSTATVSAAVDTVSSMEWYWLLNLKSLATSDRGYPIQIWRWNGYLIQYTLVGQEGPAVLLVHGFGAFLDHYRDNISPLANNGHRVWAITLLGFGKSEKPNIVYTELMWAELLRDFIVDVIGEPTHLVGNSIGGYFVATVAGFWPALAKSVILINTAGSIVPGYLPIQHIEDAQLPGIAPLGARLLLLYLKLRIQQLLKQFYPTNMERADDWLIFEMLRASHDPGVLMVLESIFTFKLNIPLNYLLECYGGEILIIQGFKDPLPDSKVKLSMLREHCDCIMIKEVDAGHCPHDEKPDVVNSIVSQWTVKVESNLRTAKKV